MLDFQIYLDYFSGDFKRREVKSMSVKEAISTNSKSGMLREVVDAKEFVVEISGRTETIAVSCGGPQPRPCSGPCRPPAPGQCVQRCRVTTPQERK